MALLLDLQDGSCSLMLRLSGVYAHEFSNTWQRLDEKIKVCVNALSLPSRNLNV